MLKGYRTIIINALTFLTAVAAFIDPSALPPEAAKILLGAVALMNIALRLLTTTAVGAKE